MWIRNRSGVCCAVLILFTPLHFVGRRASQAVDSNYLTQSLSHPFHWYEGILTRASDYLAAVKLHECSASAEVMR